MTSSSRCCSRRRRSPIASSDVTGRGGERRGGGHMPGAPHVCHAPGMTLAFDNAYEGIPSWETGRLQPVVERLLARGAITGAVLDAGCGTGRAAVRVAADGHEVVGIDVAARAVALARQGAAAAGATATLRGRRRTGARGRHRGPRGAVRHRARRGPVPRPPAHRPRALRRVPGSGRTGPGARRWWSPGATATRSAMARSGSRGGRSGPRSGGWPGGASRRSRRSSWSHASRTGVVHAWLATVAQALTAPRRPASPRPGSR